MKANPNIPNSCVFQLRLSNATTSNTPGWGQLCVISTKQSLRKEAHGAKGYLMSWRRDQLNVHCWKRSAVLHWSIIMSVPLSRKHWPLLGFFRRFPWKAEAEKVRPNLKSLTIALMRWPHAAHHLSKNPLLLWCQGGVLSPPLALFDFHPVWVWCGMET